MIDGLVSTVFGWATLSKEPPHRTDLFWKTPEDHIYAWDGESGWVRIEPPERVPMKDGDLNHG
jgi:hypothetical protein